MNINLQNIIQSEIEKLENRIVTDKLILEKFCEKRQEIAVLQEAYLKYSLHGGKPDEDMKEVEKNISGVKQVIEINIKRLNALQDYELKLQDSSICSAEERSIEDKYPIIRIS